MTTTADNILGATPPHSQHSRFLLHPTGNHATAKPSFRGVFSKPLPEWLTLPRPIPRLTSGDIILSRDAVHRESTAASDPLLGRLTPKALHDVFEAQVRYLLERFRELSRSWGKTDDDTSRSRDMAEPLAIKSKVQSTNARMRVLKSQLKDTWESFRSLLDWEPFLSRVVSTGEELVGLHGMFNVAREVCFSEFLAQVDNGTVPAEDIVDSSNALLSLRYRTRYGLAMCDYLQCIYLDPSMDDSTTIEGSLTSLDDMLELMESCAAEEATAGLAYWGSVMIRKLVDRMSKCNKWSEVIEPLSKMVGCLTSCKPMLSPTYLPWVTDCFVTLYDAHLHLENFEQAAATVHEAFSHLSHAGPSDSIIVIQIHRLKTILFGLQMRDIAAGRHRSDITEGALIAKLEQTKQYLPGNNQRDNGVSSIPVEGSAFSLPVSAPFYASTAAHSQFDLGSVQSIIHGLPPLYIGRSSISGEPHNTKLKEPLSKTSTTGAAAVRTLSVRALNQLQEGEGAAGYRPIGGGRRRVSVLTNRLSVSAMSMSDVESLVEYGLREESIVLEEDEHKDTIMEEPQQAQNRPTGRLKKQPRVAKPRRKRPPASEPLSEEDIERRQILSEILLGLIPFPDDALRLYVLIEAIRCLSDQLSGLYLVDVRPWSDRSRAEQVRIVLLDVVFDMIFCPPGKFLATALTTRQTATLAASKRMPGPTEISELISSQRLNMLRLPAIMTFMRALFTARMWERYTVFARMLDAVMLDDRAFDGDKDLKASAEKEVVLRLSMINFLNVTNDGSKVRINENELAVSPQVHTALLAVLSSLSSSLNDPGLCARFPRMFIDISKRLWSCIEPVFNRVQALSLDDIHVVTMRCIQGVISELFTEAVGTLKESEILWALDIASILGRLLQNVGEYADAVTVYSDAVEWIEHFRKAKGRKAAVFIPKYSLSDTDHSAVNIQQTLACRAVEMCTSLFRTYMRHTYQASLFEHARKTDVHRRLRHVKRGGVPEPKTLPDEVNMQEFCRDDEVLRAIFLCVHVGEGASASEQEKGEILSGAANALTKVEGAERRLLAALKSPSLQQIEETAVPLPPAFVSRSMTSITVRPRHVALLDRINGRQRTPSGYQVFCRALPITSATVAAPVVSINDVNFPGTGEVRSYTSDLTFTITGLAPHTAYILALRATDESGGPISGIGHATSRIVTILPVPMLLCWGLISEVAESAHASDIANIAWEKVRGRIMRWDCGEEVIRALDCGEGTALCETDETYFRLVENISEFAPPLCKSFSHTLHLYIARQLRKDDPPSARNNEVGELARLDCCRLLMIGVEVARTQNDVKEMLVCCVRCWEVMQPVLHSNGRDCCDILPQLRLNKRRPSTASANFITYLLTKCFDTFVQCYAALQPSDRAKAVHNYFAAVALHLVQHLLARGDKQRGQKVAEAALLLIRKVIDEDMVDAVGDSRLNDKAHIGTGKKKDLLLSHVVYHAWKSCTSDPTFGYDVCFDPRRRDNAYLTAVCDALDVEVFRITVQPIKQLQPAASTASLSAAPSTAALLRVRGNTPIVSLLTLLVQSPASAIDQLHASRTAKEYARLAACVASEGMLIAPEAIVKLCAEVEEWLVSRNLGILCFEEGTKDRNRKRKDLFKETSGQGGFDDLRGRSKKRGRKPSLAHTGGPVNSFAAKGHRNDDSVKRFTDNINEESDDADIDSPSSPPGRRISRSPERSPGRLNGPPFRKQSISPRRQKSASKQRSSSPQEQPESTAQRRKQRQALLSSFPADVRERVDQAARVLDSTLVGMWRRRRYARRARAIVAYEGESRARLAFSRGIAAWVMTERDIGVRPSVQPDRLHVLDPAFFCAVGTFHTSLTPTQRATLLSALQSLTQSVVHASRAEAYPLLVNFATVFAEVYRRGILNGHFAKNDVEKGLWKAWRVVADCVIHMLNKLELEQEESDIGASFSTARWLDRNGMPHTMHLPLHAIALFLQQTQAVLYVARKIRLMEYFLAQSLPTLDLVAPLHGAHVLHSTYLHEPSAAGLLNVIRSYEQLHHNFPTTARPRATFVAWTLMSHALLLLGVGDRPSASLFFAKALDALLNQDDVASKWISRQVTAESILMQAGAAGNTVLAAVAATMLSSIRYQERNYAVRDSLTVLASILFSAPLTTTFVHPKEPVSHATYTPQYLAPREYIFMRELPITLTSLSYVMERLLHLQRFTESVRVASVAEYAGTSCGDLLTVGKGRLVKAIALAAMGHILPALRALCAVVQGDILVGLDEQVVCNQTQRATLDSPKVTEAAVVIPFLNDLAIDPQLQELFSDTLLLEFALCKADVILTVASQQEYYIEPTAIGHLSIAYEGLRQSMQGSHEKMGPEHSYRAYRCLARLEEMRGHLAVSLRAFAALSDWDSVLIDFPEFLLKRGIFSQAFHFATKAQKAARDVNSPMETRLRTIALESALHAHWSGLMVRHPDDWTKEQAKLHDYLRALDENQLRLFGVTVDVAHAWERLGDALLCLDPTSEKMAKAHYTKALSLLQPARNGHHIARISYKRYQVDHDLAAMKQATAHLDFSKVSLPVLIPMLTSIGDFEGASNALNTFIQAAHFDVQFFGEATIMLLDVACARGDAQISEGVLASWTYSGALCKKLWDECIAEQAVARVGKRNPTSKDKKPKPVSLPEAVHRQIDFGYFALTEAGGISIDEWIRNALTSPEDVFASNLEFSQEATGADIATAVKFLADLYKKQSRLDSMFTGQLAQLLAVWFRSRPGSSGIPLLATLTKDGSPMPGDTAVLVRRGERMILLHTASKPVAKKSQGRQQPTTPSTPAKGHGRTSTTGDSASQPLPELVWHAVEVMPDVYSDVHQTLTRVHQLLHSHEVDGDEIDDLWWKSTEAIKRSVLGTSVEEDTERPKPTTEIVELALKCFGDPGAIVMESAPSAQGLFIGWMARLVALKQRKIKPRVSFSL